MKAELERRWAEEIDKRMGQLKTPLDVMRRHVSGEDYIDSAILAGVSISDILAGQVAESHVPPQVIEAFHDQYSRTMRSSWRRASTVILRLFFFNSAI